MFGHKAGAFTGALKETKGLFEEADNGTIFLDEIGEMAFDLQAKLLRILETGEFLKIGDTKPVKVNVRVIAATNRDLAKEIADGILDTVRRNWEALAAKYGISRADIEDMRPAFSECYK